MTGFDDREQAAYERTVELFRTAPADARVSDATLGGPPGVALLVLYQRLSPSEAVSRGLRIDGDGSAPTRLLECIERP